MWDRSSDHHLPRRDGESEGQVGQRARAREAADLVPAWVARAGGSSNPRYASTTPRERPGVFGQLSCLSLGTIRLPTRLTPTRAIRRGAACRCPSPERRGHSRGGGGSERGAAWAEASVAALPARTTDTLVTFDEARA